MSGEFCVPWLKNGRLVLDDESKLVMLSRKCPCKSVCEREIPLHVRFPFPFIEKIVDTCTLTLDGVTEDIVLGKSAQFSKFSSNRWFHPDDLNPDYDSQAQLKYEMGEITYSQYMATKDKYHYKSTEEADPESGDICADIWQTSVVFRGSTLWLHVGFGCDNAPQAGYSLEAEGDDEETFYLNKVFFEFPAMANSGIERAYGEYFFATKFPVATHGTACQIIRGAAPYALPDLELVQNTPVRSRENGEKIADYLKEVCDGKKTWFTRKIGIYGAGGIKIYQDRLCVLQERFSGHLGNFRDDHRTYTWTGQCSGEGSYNFNV